ncbi:MAG: aspartate--tRNA(Asn) ligase [Candidatus Aenigmatarchaeota archaeon]|nr:MAG: aspartate--tRNA(Asn) ligase [Candidatus Aenigmarchaeota archaeon]
MGENGLSGERIYASEAKSRENKEILLRGWASAVRDLGNIVFVVLRDCTGEVQLLAKKDNECFDKIKELKREDVIEVIGIPIKNEKASNGVEVKIKEFKLVNSAEPLPIEFSGKIETDISKRLDYRFLDLRNIKNKKIFELKSAVVNYTREFFTGRNFVEVHTPKIVAQGAEGGSELFPILYYNKEGYLTQSPQFYKQLMQAAGFEKVFEIGPVYRAEKSHTTRHLSEYWGIDSEISFIENYEAVMGLIEDMLCSILDNIKKNCDEIIEPFNVNFPKYKKPFPRITLKEAFELLGKEPGNDLSPEEEKMVGDKIKEKYDCDFVFITQYPFEKRPFYTMKNKDNKETTDSFDLVFRGVELITGGQREHRIKIIEEQAKEKGISLESIKFYVKSFRYGMPPHGGFGLGLERFIMQFLNLPNVREAVLFPRDVERLTP